MGKIRDATALTVPKVEDTFANDPAPSPLETFLAFANDLKMSEFSLRRLAVLADDGLVGAGSFPGPFREDGRLDVGETFSLVAVVLALDSVDLVLAIEMPPVCAGRVVAAGNGETLPTLRRCVRRVSLEGTENLQHVVNHLDVRVLDDAVGFQIV